jgi:hypothetical protein
MQKTLMLGLNEKDMQAVVNTYKLNDFYYPTLFPLKETNTLTWKMLEGQAGLRIAADLVARGSSIPKKTREAIARIQGDIPKIAISRDKLEDELTEYDIMIAMAGGNPDLRALVDFWAEDTQFCWDGVAARLEWIALQQISLGKVKVTNTNNSAVLTEFDVDYQLESDQKGGVNTRWDNGTTGKPFSKDFPAIVKAYRAKGIYLKYAFMNLDTFVSLASQDETIKMCATMLANIAGAAQVPALTDVNSMMTRRPDLYGLQIVVIDQQLTIELPNGNRTTVNPFESNVVTFSESQILGTTYWKRPIDLNVQNSVALKVMNGHTLIKKFSNEEPVKEVTQGIANAFPAWNQSTRSYLLQTNNTSWNK